MQVDINDAQCNLFELINLLLDNKEDVVYISENGAIVAQLAKADGQPIKRIGVAKGKLSLPDDFDAWDREIEELINV